MNIKVFLIEKLPFVFFICFGVYWVIYRYVDYQDINFPMILFTVFITRIMLVKKLVLSIITGVLIFFLIVFSYLVTNVNFSSPVVTNNNYPTRLIIYYVASVISLIMASQMAIVNYRKLQSS